MHRIKLKTLITAWLVVVMKQLFHLCLTLDVFDRHTVTDEAFHYKIY